LVLDRDPDQIGSSRKAELVLYVAAIIRHGLVAEADRIGDLQQAVAFAEEPENLQVAARQILEGVRQGGTAGRPDGEQGKFLRDIGLYVFVPRGNAFFVT
jgi:hypothetical protein